MRFNDSTVLLVPRNVPENTHYRLPRDCYNNYIYIYTTRRDIYIHYTYRVSNQNLLIVISPK